MTVSVTEPPPTLTLEDWLIEATTEQSAAALALEQARDGLKLAKKRHDEALATLIAVAERFRTGARTLPFEARE